MLLVLTQEETQQLIQNQSKKKIKVDFPGENQLTLKYSGVKVNLFLSEVRPKQVTFIYKVNSVVNFLLDKFLNLDKPGIFWDKEADTITLDLKQIGRGEQLDPVYLKQMLIDDGKLILDFDLVAAEET
ncbi:hypothetical protein [Algoriphagus namhaensis]